MHIGKNKMENIKLDNVLNLCNLSLKQYSIVVPTIKLQLLNLMKM